MSCQCNTICSACLLLRYQGDVNCASIGGATAPTFARYPMLLKAEDNQYISLAADIAGGVGRDDALKTPEARFSHW